MIRIAAFVIATLLSAGSAVAVTSVLDARLAVSEDAVAPAAQPTRRSPRPAPRPRMQTADAYIEGIMRRNLFDKTVIDTWNPAPEDGEDQTSLTDLDVSLLGTVLAEPAALSVAMIRSEEESLMRSYGVGDALMDRTVVDIADGRVTLRRQDGGEEFLEVSDAVSDAPAPSTPARPRAGGANQGVESLGEDRYRVTEAVRSQMNMAGLSAMGRLMPHMPGGEFGGFKVSALRRGRLGDQLGLKNGDVLHAVNGTKLDSADVATQAFDSLRAERDFCLGVTRRGEPVELCYEME
ncbi:MAG: hypothetical protein KTR31_25195 [Myxococcales bacterium]|nr:hypothetical protein [Myxococcales bacterium]